MQLPWSERMRDTDNPPAIGPDWDRAVAGYLPVGDPAGPWSAHEWQSFPRRRKLPIVEVSDLTAWDPNHLAFDAIVALQTLRVPIGKYTAVAVETQINPAWLEAYGDAMHIAGYKTWVYGSASTLFSNPQLNGYWVANWVTTGPMMYDHSGVRATQYANPNTGSGGDWDSSTILDWIYYSDSWWR